MLLLFDVAGRTVVLADQPNVLFIAIDDLRADLSGLGIEEARTPHLDEFAESARPFSHHYVQVPTCGASRCALIRGKYPELKEYLSNQSIRETHPKWVDSCLPAVFRNAGYQTLALGKVTHYPGGMAGKEWSEPPIELPGVWDRCWIPDSPWRTAQGLMHGYASGAGRVSGQTLHWEAKDGPDTSYPDAWIADEAIRTLEQLCTREKPWLFCVGFFKPHLPFAAPKKWFELHDGNISDLSVEATKKPSWFSGWHKSGEFMNNYRHPDGIDVRNNIEYARKTRLAYAAATSYVDAQIGRLLKALNEKDPDRKTIVVIWSDHGFLLGEHSIWGKHCLYEHALRSPLIVRIPNMNHPGQVCSSIVESVDIFPTLLDLCGLIPPPGLDGQSLQSQLADPTIAAIKPARGFWNGDRTTVRNSRWRLTSIPDQGTSGSKVYYELFDYQNDPWETINTAEEHPQVVAELSQHILKIP